MGEYVSVGVVWNCWVLMKGLEWWTHKTPFRCLGIQRFFVFATHNYDSFLFFSVGGVWGFDVLYNCIGLSCCGWIGSDLFGCSGR